MIGILKTITVIGTIISMLLMIPTCVFILSLNKNEKYANKLVEETPLMKYVIIFIIGLVFFTISQVCSLVIIFCK